MRLGTGRAYKRCCWRNDRALITMGGLNVCSNRGEGVGRWVRDSLTEKPPACFQTPADWLWVTDRVPGSQITFPGHRCRICRVPRVPHVVSPPSNSRPSRVLSCIPVCHPPPTASSLFRTEDWALLKDRRLSPVPATRPHSIVTPFFNSVATISPHGPYPSPNH